DSSADTIVGIDINGEKEAIARQMGCNEFINPKSLDQPLEEVLRAKGIEYAFDCVGNEDVLNTALKSLTPWGSLTVIGLGKRGNKVETSVAELLEGRQVAGGYFGNMKPREANQRLVDMMCAGNLKIDSMITHRMRLEDIGRAFDVLKAGETIRTTITCRAAVLWKEGSPLTVETITVDPPKKGEVRVRMVAAGVCATDAHFVWGWPTDLALDFEGLPVVLGHEGAGVVESVGAGVTAVSAGDKVVLMWMPECGVCDLCRNPKTNFCSVGNFYTTLYHDNRETRMKVNGKPLLSLAGTSTFSEYAVVRQSQVAKVNPSADLKTGCIIGCAVGTGYGSATNIARV
ncbi:unnamed protein product, partial [Oppiella nova]